MSSNAAAPRYGVWTAVAVCSAIVAGIAAIAGWHKPAQIDPGTEVLSVEDDSIRTVRYRTGAMTLTAWRNVDMGQFAVDVTYKDGRAAQHCESSTDLAGLLPGLVDIVAKRQLTPQQAVTEFPVLLGTLVLDDQIPSEPIEPITVRATQDRSRVAVVLKDAAVETTMAPAAFVQLSAGCSALGKPVK